MTAKRHISIRDLPKVPKGTCRWCRKLVPPPRRNWCGEACIHEYKIRANAQYARQCVYERDRGICAECGLDTEKLHLTVLEAARKSMFVEIHPSHPDCVLFKLNPGLGKRPIVLGERWFRYDGWTKRWVWRNLYGATDLGLARVLQNYGDPPVDLAKPLRLSQIARTVILEHYHSLYGNCGAGDCQCEGCQILRQYGFLWRQHWWEADHINPVEFGGGACGLENLQTLCRTCHKKKSAAQRKQKTRRKAKES